MPVSRIRDLLSAGRGPVWGFSIALTLLIANAIVSFRNVNELAEHDRWVSHTHEVVAGLEALTSTVSNAESGQRGYLLTRQAQYLQPYRDAIVNIQARIARLRGLLSDNSNQLRLLDELESTIDRRVALLQQGTEIMDRDGADAARAFTVGNDGRETMHKVRQLIGHMTAAEDRLLDSRSDDSLRGHRQAIATVLMATALGVILAVAGFELLRRDLGMRKQAADALQHAHDQLEARVRERTAELANTNEALAAEISQRKHFAEQLRVAHEALQAANSRLAAVIEGTTDQVAALDPQGRFILFNSSYRRHFALHYQREVALGEKFAELVPDSAPAKPRLLELWQRALAGEEFTTVDDYGTSGAGRLYFELSFSSIRDAHGVQIGASKVARDITARKHAEQQLDEFNRRLQQSNRELQDFASVASHDLQEPLRKIQAFGDRLAVYASAKLDDESRDYLARMQRAAVRMSALINDLLTFSRVSTRALPFKELDLNEVVGEVLGDLEERIQQTAGQVIVEKLPTIEADPLQIRQLFQNLIANGLKFHKPDVAPIVRVEGFVEPTIANGNGSSTNCRLVVSDNGVGFDAKYTDRIFNVFQRLHARGEFEGTGMGLAICRKIVQRHFGSISADSAVGHGTSFFVTLPVKQPQGASDGEQAT